MKSDIFVKKYPIGTTKICTEQVENTRFFISTVSGISLAHCFSCFFIHSIRYFCCFHFVAEFYARTNTRTNGCMNLSFITLH